MKQPTREEKKLIKKVQQGFAYADIETCRVYSMFDDWTCTGDEYLGTIRRKYLPYRRVVEKELREMSERELEEWRKRKEELKKMKEMQIIIFWGELGKDRAINSGGQKQNGIF